MQILIDDEKLNLLLETKKNFIGKKVALDTVLSAVSLLISVAFASYEGVLGGYGYVLKIIFVIIGIFFTFKSVVDVFKSIKNNYTYQDLFEDINKLNEIAHNHSIVILKDQYNEFSNRFLVYYDERWNGKLFLNYKDNRNNEDFIIDHLSRELKIDKSMIELEYITKEIHQKYSVSAKVNKIYCHKFYLASVKNFPEYMKEDSFEKDGKKYFWTTMQELENDKAVMDMNADIVSYVKKYF